LDADEVFAHDFIVLKAFATHGMDEFSITGCQI
jgi:hypothetical protein